jgi:hypothetical protein
MSARSFHIPNAELFLIDPAFLAYFVGMMTAMSRPRHDSATISLRSTAASILRRFLRNSSTRTFTFQTSTVDHTENAHSAAPRPQILPWVEVPQKLDPLPRFHLA